MKKATFLILFAILATLGTHAQYYIIDTLQLNSAYRALMADPNDPAKQMAFFEAFPESWTEFFTTYGIPYNSGNTKHGPVNKNFDKTMYHLCMDHTSAFSDSLNSVPDSIYCAKLVNISTVAIVNGDIDDCIKFALHQTMKHRKPALLKVISELTLNDQMRFWMFYWGTLVLVGKDWESEYKQLYKEMLRSYPEEAKLMKLAFEISYGQTVFDGLGHTDSKRFFPIIN